MARVPPRSRASSAGSTRSPTGAKRMAESSGSGGGSARPTRTDRPELECQRPRALRSGHDVHSSTLGHGNLSGRDGLIPRIRICPADPRGKLRPSQRPIADDSRTEEGGRLFIAEGVGNRVGVAFLGDHILRVAAVDVPAGEERCGTEVLSPVEAEPTGSTGVAQPGNSHPFSQAEPGTARTEGVDHPHHLMAGNHQPMSRGQIALGKVQIGAAHPARPNVHPDLHGPRHRHLTIDPNQRSAVDRSRRVDCPGTHSFGRHAALRRSPTTMG